MADIRHIRIFLQTVKYALHIRGICATDFIISPILKYALQIYGRYAIYLIIFPKLLSMPWIIPSDTRQNYLFISTIKYAPYISRINVTDLLIPLHN